jgi:hypothetical protein
MWKSKRAGIKLLSYHDTWDGSSQGPLIDDITEVGKTK